MNQQLLITMSPDDLKQIVKEGVTEAIQEQSKKDISKTTYSINETRIILGRHSSTVKKLMCEGKLKTTSDGIRVLASSLEEYLQNK